MGAHIAKAAAVGGLMLAAACQGIGLDSRSDLVTDSRISPVVPEAEIKGPVLSVPAPAWRVGDYWRYNDGYGLEVVGAEGGATRLRRLDDPSQWITRRGFLREAAQSSSTLRQITYRSVPADAGLLLRSDRPLVFTREYTANEETLVHLTSWVVEDREQVSVPAGQFDTYVVVMRTRNATTGWTGFERWWYAPEVGNYVRMEYRYGNQGIGSRVLIDHGRGGVPQASSGTPAASSQRSGATSPGLY